MTPPRHRQTALNVPAARFFVAHPIQDRTDEMVDLADAAIFGLVALLTVRPDEPRR